MTPPVLTVIAGPNGAGKSTIYKIVQPMGQFVNADDIEALLPPTLSKADREKTAARKALETVKGLLSTTQSFVVETTLAGKWPLKLMEDAKAAGYRVELIYICLDSPQLSIERVAFRVRNGGHDIPTEAILRRYPRSLANLRPASQLADEFAVIDNSDRKPRWVMKYANGSAGDTDLITPLDQQIYAALFR